MARAEVQLALDATPFAAGLRRAEAGLSAFGGKLKTVLGGIGLAGGIATTKTIVDFASSIQDTSSALNIGVEALQGFRGAFSQSGVDAAKFDKGLETLNRSIDEATKNIGTARNSFTSLGVTWKDITEDAPDEILLKMAEGMRNATNPTAALAAAIDLLGKGGGKMAGLLREGRAEIEKQADAVSKMTAQEVRQLDEAGDAWERFGTTMKVFSGQRLAIVQAAREGAGWNPFLPGINAMKAMFGAENATGVPTAEEIAAARSRVGKTRGAAAAALEDPRITKAAEDAYEQITKDQEEDAKKQLELAKEYTREKAQQLDDANEFMLANRKAWDDEEKKLETLKQQTAEKKLQTELTEAISAAEQARERQITFNRATPDERRQFNRDFRDEEHARARERRMAEAMADPKRRARDARAGAGKIGEEVALTEASIKRLTDTIELLIAK